MDIIKTLEARGFLESYTDIDALTEHLSSDSRTFYVGFDPTGDSLHVGHLVPVMATWMQRAGHRPIAVLGGGTAMVGDPSGKDQTREMITAETIAHNRECFRGQISRFLRVNDPKATQFEDGDNGAILWTMGRGFST